MNPSIHVSCMNQGFIFIPEILSKCVQKTETITEVVATTHRIPIKVNFLESTNRASLLSSLKIY